MVDLGEFCCSVAVRGVLLRPTTTGALLTLGVAMADAGSDPGLLPPVILTTLAATNNGFPWGKEVAFLGKDFGSRSTGLDWLTPDCARICTICFRSEFRSDMMNGCKLATWRRLNSPRRLTSFDVIGQFESSCFNIARFWTTNLKFMVCGFQQNWLKVQNESYQRVD